MSLEHLYVYIYVVVHDRVNVWIVTALRWTWTGPCRDLFALSWYNHGMDIHPPLRLLLLLLLLMIYCYIFSFDTHTHRQTETPRTGLFQLFGGSRSRRHEGGNHHHDW